MTKRPVSRGTSVEASWPASKVEMRSLAKIIPYELNPRTHPPAQISLISTSMKSDGVLMPILVDEGGVILAGHGRRLAALEAGFDRYPVMVARSLSEEQKRAIRIKDNQLGLMSGWDKQLMQAELHNLKLEGYDIQLLGFEEFQLRSFGVEPFQDQGNDPEGTPEPPAKPVSRLGDIWLLSDHRLLCGDSTKAEDVQTVLKDSRPHLMITDPPYGVEYDANWRNEAAEKGSIGYGARAIAEVTNDDRVNWEAAWQLFPGSIIYCWHAGRHASEVQKSLEGARFEIVCQIIWAKPRFVISRGDYHWQHEPCWYAVRKGQKHRWNGDRSQTTLWEISHAKSETGHSTQKPIECMKRPIENNSKIGDSVYDPFCGSGTTIIAAEMTKRKCFAIELSPAYVDVAVLRWEKFTGNQATLEATGRTFAETKTEREAEAKKGKTKGGAAQSRGRRSAPYAAPAASQS